MKRSRAKQYVLGKAQYTTRDIQNRVKQIKTDTPYGSLVNCEESIVFLKDLFSLHPNYEAKTRGQPVSGMRHVKSGKYSCFHFCTEGGIESDFSVPKCLITVEQYNMQRWRAALRNSVIPQILDYKKERGFGIVQCDLCHVKCCNYDWDDRNRKSFPRVVAVHVDHDPVGKKFQAIWESFLETHPDAMQMKLVREPVPYMGREDHWMFEKDETLEAWIAYHQEHAKLRFLCQKCNCTLH